MTLDHRTGRYTFANNKLLRVFFRTPKTTEGWEFVLEVGPRYTGPGVWFATGSHFSFTVWLTSNTALDLILLCGDCTICERIYDHPRGSGRKLKWIKG